MSNRNTISTPYTGTTRAQLALPPLDPSHFQVNERDLSQYLAFTAKIGQAVTFYDLKGRPDGNWAQFLLSEPLFLTAVIKETDGTELYNQALDFHKAMTSRTTPSMRLLFFQYYFDTCLEVTLRINRWYQFASRLFFPTTFAEYLTDIITNEGAAAWQQVYNDYYVLVENLGLKNKMLIKSQRLAPIWRFDPFPSRYTTTQAWQEASPPHNPEILTPAQEIWLDEVGRNAQQLFHVQDLIIGAAGQYFAESLKREDIPAQTGLMLSFFRSLQEQQSILNQATEKHLNFYYREVLGLRPKTAMPDKTWLTFVLDKDQQTYTLPSATAFAAGTLPDSTTVREFATDEELVINKTKLAAYQTLSLPQGSMPYPSLSGLYQGNADKTDTIPTVEWPAFGQGIASATMGPLSTQATRVGWAFTASDLLLTSGNRWLTLEFSYAAIEPKASPAHSAIEEWNQWIAEKSQAEASTWLQGLFSVEITEAKGWMPLPYATEDAEGNSCYATFQASPASPGPATEGTLTLHFKLDNTAAATANYDETLHGPGYTTAFPVLRITLTNTEADTPEGISIYPILRELALQRTQLSVSVTDFKNFILLNDDGALDPSKPFTPFGTQAQKGTEFLMGSQELFCKPITQLSFGWDWDELPISKSFFQQYLAYNLHPLMTHTSKDGDALPHPVPAEPFYMNPVFQVTASALQPEGWIPLTTASSPPYSPEGSPPASPNTYWSLYTGLISHVPYTYGERDEQATKWEAYEKESMATSPPTSPIDFKLRTSFDIHLDLGGLKSSPSLGPVTEYKPDDSFGFVRLQLANPVQGFGTTDYPRVVTDVTTHNTWVIMKAAQNKTAPAPQVCSLGTLLEQPGQDMSPPDMGYLPEDLKQDVEEIQQSIAEVETALLPLEDSPPTNWVEEQIAAIDVQGILNDAVQILIGQIHQLLHDRMVAFIEEIFHLLTSQINQDIEKAFEAVKGFQAEELPKMVENVIRDFNTQLDKLDKEDETWAHKTIDSLSVGGMARDLLVRVLDRLLDPLQDAYNGIMDEFRRISQPLFTLLRTTLPTRLLRVNSVFESTIAQLGGSPPNLLGSPPDWPTSPPDAWEQALKDECATIGTEINDQIRTVLTKAYDNLANITQPVNALITLVNKLIKDLENAYQHCLEPNPNTPYIPKAKDIVVSYQASHSWSSDELVTYSIGPATVWSAKDEAWLPVYSASGYAYLGFSDYTLGTPLTLLVALRAPVPHLQQDQLPSLQIEYPTNEGWKPLPITRDGTQGLLQSGIVLFTLPNDLQIDCPEVAYPTATPMAWIRMVQPTNPPEVQFSYLAPHAVACTDTVAGLAPIAPGTITKPENAALKSVSQPMVSQDGSTQQTEAEYWQSGAWRLQNKQRAGRLKDYETLAMEAFPQLFQAKALNYYGMKLTRNQINLLLISQKLLSDSDAYAPYTPAHVLLQVLSYLEPLQAPGLKLNLINPTFAPLEIKAQVLFEEGYQTEKQLDSLRLAIRQYLAPWISNSPFTDTERPAQWSKGALYAFIKSQPKVRNIFDFGYEVFHSGKVQSPPSLVMDDPQVLIVPGSQDGIMLSPPRS